MIRPALRVPRHQTTLLWEYPAITRLPWLPGWPHHSYFVHIFYLVYLSVILLALAKSAYTKMLEIKYIKNIIPCRTSNAVDPAKRDVERTRIERDILDFRPMRKRACQLTRKLMGLIAVSFLGTRGFLCSCSDAALPLVFRDHSGA